LLDDFVAERAGADDQDAGVMEALLVPPVDQPEAGVAVVVLGLQGEVERLISPLLLREGGRGVGGGH
jgi:hypothetical protein